ncbi:MAG: PbpA [Desulfobacteraceae bacterium]|nr:PbpA [Desulfobacteraceae bacterium]MBC2757355.1 PbpA [Desulfobacteraceae bacterium]
MLNRSKTKNYGHSNKWRDYQSKLKKKDATRRSYLRIPLYAAVLCVLILVGNGIFILLDKTLATQNKDYSIIFAEQVETLDKYTLQKIFNKIPFASASDKNFELTTGGKTYQIISSLDPFLQKFIIDHIDRKNSMHFGFVAMDPATGRILSMVSYDKNSKDANICIIPDYPAASLFKIITAAAVIEKCGFNCNTPVTFNDNKYTLYKTQLKDRINKYTNQTTFEKSFADSVNPVFGKIGKNRLGKSTLVTYAAAFGFNQTFDFEIPLRPSIVSVSDDPYNWAEIASGFNNETLISPLHGALVVSSIVNNGKLIAPTIIDEINKKNQVVYHRNSRDVSDIINPNTAITLKKLMNATIVSGTASKSFSRFKKDKILSKLNIGGKTGSINNNAQHLKYDWFAGFAEEKNGSNKIVVSVLVVHQDYIGTRAASYSRMAIKEYFQNYYANINEQQEKKSAAL